MCNLGGVLIEVLLYSRIRVTNSVSSRKRNKGAGRAGSTRGPRNDQHYIYSPNVQQHIYH